MVDGQVSALSTQASPPAKKHTILWSISAAMFGFFSLAGLAHPGFGTVITIGITAMSVRFALQAKAYNALKFPELYQRWERSFMCNRCGEVFTP